MAVIAFVLLGCAVVAMGQQRIDLADRFTGKIADPSLADARPDSGIINDLAAWQKLWSAWRPGQPIKEVDFAQQIVLVDTVPGPNMVFSSLLQLDEQGDLKYEIASQRGAGPGFGYLIMIVSKTGINSVNGKSLDGKPIEARPIAKTPNEAAPQTKPDNRPVPPVTDQTASEPKPSLGTPGVDPNTVGMEFVKVEMVGRVRAQFQSVGPETTGTLVAANGIIWELDLHQDEQLMETARGLGNSLARISGDLRMLRQRGGLEARVRWIVHVESMESLGIEAGMPPATSPLEELNSPRNAQPIAGNDRPNPAPNSPMESNPGQSPPLQPNQTPSQSVPDSAVLDAPIRPSFTQVSILTSDGQTQMISPDGLVRYESKPRNLSNQWNSDPATIAKLHRFVAETAWDLVPKKTLSNSNDPNEIGYTISIQTPRGVSRFYIDRTAVPDQPTMKQFFEIVSEIASNR